MDITLENISNVEVPEDLRTAILGRFETDARTYLGTKDFIVQPKTEYDAAIKTASDAAVQLAIDNESARLYPRIDTLIETALGEKKPGGVKTRDWLEQLGKAGKFPFTDETFTKLKEAMTGKQSPTKDAEIEALRKQIENSQKDAQTASKTAFTKQVNRVVAADFRNAPVTVDSSIKDPTALTAAKNAAITNLRTMFDTLYEGAEDETTGELYFVKKGTKDALMNTTEGRPMTPTEIIRKDYPMFLTPAGHKQEGAGTQKQQGGGTGGFQSLAEIRKHAIEVKGFPAYTPEYEKFVTEEGKKAQLLK